MTSQRTHSAVMPVIKQSVLLLLLSLSFCLAVIEDDERVYHNQFAVGIPNATEPLVQLIAEKHGFRSLGQVSWLPALE